MRHASYALPVRPNLQKGGDPGWLTSGSYQFRANIGLFSQNYHRETMDSKTNLTFSFRLSLCCYSLKIRPFAATGGFPPSGPQLGGEAFRSLGGNRLWLATAFNPTPPCCTWPAALFLGPVLPITTPFPDFGKRLDLGKFSPS